MINVGGEHYQDMIEDKLVTTMASGLDRVNLQLASRGRSAWTDHRTPRRSPSRELPTRFGGLMAYSYTCERLCPTTEELGRGLGKGTEGRINSRAGVYNRLPLRARRVMSSPSLGSHALVV